jgi:chromosome segregation ATPase
MGEVKRFDLGWEHSMESAEDGEYVLYTEYAALEQRLANDNHIIVDVMGPTCAKGVNAMRDRGNLRDELRDEKLARETAERALRNIYERQRLLQVLHPVQEELDLAAKGLARDNAQRDAALSVWYAGGPIPGAVGVLLPGDQDNRIARLESALRAAIGDMLTQTASCDSHCDSRAIEREFQRYMGDASPAENEQGEP